MSLNQSKVTNFLAQHEHSITLCKSIPLIFPWLWKIGIRVSLESYQVKKQCLFLSWRSINHFDLEEVIANNFNVFAILRIFATLTWVVIGRIPIYVGGGWIRDQKQGAKTFSFTFINKCIGITWNFFVMRHARSKHFSIFENQSCHCQITSEMRQFSFASSFWISVWKSLFFFTFLRSYETFKSTFSGFALTFFYGSW